mmetsp:Transcript_13037/g.15896  ORF Transcript_13037/g.15896 Transcript_13037/m.15896 type:complete len:95 (+) Transcript_13037:2-286(+)
MQVATVGKADCNKKTTGHTENENNVGTESKLSNSHISSCAAVGKSSLKATEKDEESIYWLEMVYHLAVYNTQLIYHVFEILPPIKKCRYTRTVC